MGAAQAYLPNCLLMAQAQALFMLPDAGRRTCCTQVFIFDVQYTTCVYIYIYIIITYNSDNDNENDNDNDNDTYIYIYIHTYVTYVYTRTYTRKPRSRDAGFKPG